jgi:uncharacterized protein YciI
MQSWLPYAVAIAVAIGGALSFAWWRGASAVAAPAGGKPDIRAVVFHAPGPAWAKGTPFREQPGVQAHVDHYRALLANKTLALGGPFLDDTGGMMIAASGVTVDELKAISAADPAVKSGLLTATVKPWMIAMKGE